MPRVFFALVVLFSLLAAPSAHAQPRGAADGPLGVFSEADRNRLAPLLSQGIVSLTEFVQGDGLPAVLVAMRVNATPAQVAEAIAHPERYPATMDLLKSSSVTGRYGDAVSFDWVWQTSVFELRGSNTMTQFSPPEAHPESGYRFDVRSTQGDLGTGRATWRVYPYRADASLVTLSIRLDLRDANYISRQMADAARPVNRAANMSLAFLMMLGIEKQAESVSGRPPFAFAPRPISRMNVTAFAPLLERGDIVVFHGSTDSQRSVTAFGRMWAPPERIHALMANPESLGTTLVPGSRAEIVERTDEAQLFAWEIGIPLIGASGRMRMVGQAPSVRVEGVSGSLARGRWTIDARTFNGNDVILVTRGEFDPADTSWLLRGLVGSSEGFGHGLASACELMLVRAVRSLAQPD